jgi:hypothetical protein
MSAGTWKDPALARPKGGLGQSGSAIGDGCYVTWGITLLDFWVDILRGRTAALRSDRFALSTIRSANHLSQAFAPTAASQPQRRQSKWLVLTVCPLLVSR